MTQSTSGRRSPTSPAQLSLRTFLGLALVVGTVVGIFGPDLVRAFRQATVPPPLPPAPIPIDVRYSEDPSNGYYESAETPLR